MKLLHWVKCETLMYTIYPPSHKKIECMPFYTYIYIQKIINRISNERRVETGKQWK